MGLLNEIATCRSLGYRSLADGARLYRMEKTGFSNAQSLRPLETSQRAAYFLLALYYIAQDQLRSITSSFMPHTFLQVCLDGAGRWNREGGGGVFTRTFLMLNMGGEVPPLNAEGAANILIENIMRSSEHLYTFRELMQVFKSQYTSYGKITHTILQDALNLLLRKREIIRINEGFMLYNQAAAIAGVQGFLIDQLPKVSDLQNLFDIAGNAIRSLFDNVDLYLIAEVPDADAEMKTVFGDNKSSHMEWKTERRGGVFRLLIEENARGKPNSLFIEDIANSDQVGEAGPIFPEALAAYQERFEKPDAVLFAAAPVMLSREGLGKVGAIGLKVHGWAGKGQGFNSVVYKGGDRAEAAARIEVDQAVEGLVLTIANQVARLAAQKPRKTLKELMPIVAASSQSLQIQQRSAAIVEFESDRYHPESHVMKLRRRNAQGKVVSIGFEIIVDPFRLLSGQEYKAQEIVNDMFRVFAAAWNPVVGSAGIDESKFRKFVEERYWKNAARLVAMRDELKKLCGFATLVRERVNTKDIIRLAGTVLDPVFQGMRLSVKLNRAMLCELWREGRNRPMPVCTYTGNPLVLGSLMGLEGVYPDPHQPDKRPTQKQIEIFRELAKRHFPDAEIDEEHFIVRGGLKTLGLGYDSEKIQWHRDQKVNKFFADHVNSKNGDLVFPIGFLTRRVLWRETIRDLFFKIFRMRISGGNRMTRRALI